MIVGNDPLAKTAGVSCAESCAGCEPERHPCPGCRSLSSQCSCVRTMHFGTRRSWMKASRTSASQSRLYLEHVSFEDARISSRQCSTGHDEESFLRLQTANPFPSSSNHRRHAFPEHGDLSLLAENFRNPCKTLKRTQHHGTNVKSSVRQLRDLNHFDCCLCQLNQFYYHYNALRSYGDLRCHTMHHECMQHVCMILVLREILHAHTRTCNAHKHPLWPHTLRS